MKRRATMCKCGQSLLWLPCFDGHERPFVAEPVPAETRTRWVWRRRAGMVEAGRLHGSEAVSGLLLHHCRVEVEQRRPIRDLAGRLV